MAKRKKGPSPTARAIAILKGHGAKQVGIVERFNPHVGPHGIRQDLYGYADLLAIGSFGTLAVQATAASCVSSRLKKLLDSDASEAVRDCLEAGWRVEVWGLRPKPDRHGDSLMARSLLLEEDGTIRVSHCSETLCSQTLHLVTR